MFEVFGKILSINNDIILVENLKKQVDATYDDVHVVFEYLNQKIVGQISTMTPSEIEITLIGEIENNVFKQGIIKKPHISSKLRIINSVELPLIIGKQEYDSKNTLYLGKSIIYSNYNVSVGINSFLSNHFSIIGNTGSGKSCSFARLIQNLFYRKENYPLNSRFVIFDVYGEYNSAFSKFNEKSIIKTKNVTTSSSSKDTILNIPVNLLEVDDLALLLNVDNIGQIPVLEKAYLYVHIFMDNSDISLKYKNSIISKAIFDILTSGRTSTQIRDQIIAILTSYNTKDINLDSPIVQPGYTRTLRQCLNIDTTGKINTMHLVVDYVSTFMNIDVESYLLNPNIRYSLKDLYYALDFALISEGTLKSDKIFDQNNPLKVRLDSIINSSSASFFDSKDFVDREKYIEQFFMTNRGENAQIILINLNYIEERLAKIITKIISKILFNYCADIKERGSFPINIVLEEAHRYVQNDNDINIIGYNIFDRITKEGRKYGVILGLITQRPSELSNTALSQCTNFLVFRMFHPKDIEIVSSISSNINLKTLERLKSLRPGVGIGFGSAFKMPLIINFDLPSPMPESSNTDLESIWFKKQ